MRKASAPFDKTLSPRRSYAFSDLPLSDFKKVGASLGYQLASILGGGVSPLIAASLAATAASRR